MLDHTQLAVLQKCLRGRALVYGLLAGCIGFIAAIIIALFALGEWTGPIAGTTALALGGLTLFFAYWTVASLRRSRNAADFPIRTLEGYALFKDTKHHQPQVIKGQRYMPYAITSARHVTVQGDTCLYPLFLEQPPAHAALRVAVVDVASPMFGGKHGRIVVACECMGEDATRAYEESLPAVWSQACLSMNESGQASPKQVRALLADAWRSLMLFALAPALVAGGIGWLVLDWWKVESDGRLEWKLALAAVFMSGVTIYWLREFFKTRAAVRAGKVGVVHAAMKKHALDGNLLALRDNSGIYVTYPKTIAQQAPQFSAARYYFVEVEGLRTIVNFQVG